jgi:hypothetical protein
VERAVETRWPSGLRRGGERWVAAQAATGCGRRSERGGEWREEYGAWIRVGEGVGYILW